MQAIFARGTKVPKNPGKSRYKSGIKKVGLNFFNLVGLQPNTPFNFFGEILYKVYLIITQKFIISHQKYMRRKPLKVKGYMALSCSTFGMSGETIHLTETEKCSGPFYWFIPVCRSRFSTGSDTLGTNSKFNLAFIFHLWNESLQTFYQPDGFICTN
mgnify:CR=1 FL=1